MSTSNRTGLALLLAAALSIAGAAHAAQEGNTSGTVEDQFAMMSDADWHRMPREERAKRFRRNYIARFEPTGRKPSIDRLDYYVLRFAEINIYDPRLFLFRVTAEAVEGTTGSVRLSGEVSLEDHKNGIERTMRELGFNVVSSNIDVLPDPMLGPNVYAIATTTAATMRREPKLRSEQVNSVPFGGVIRLLREAKDEDAQTSFTWHRGMPNPDTFTGKWYLGQSLEGYFGFFRDDQFLRTELKRPRLPDAMLLEPASVKHEGRDIEVPAGAYLWKTSRRSQVAGTHYEIPPYAIPLPSGVPVAEFAQTVFSERAIMDVAKPLMNTSYQWGGTTHAGIDCSGFTQFVYKARGLFLPRDSEQQATVGQLVAFGKDVKEGALPGDLIFFINDQGKINHIAVSLGEGRIIHSAGRGVHTTELDKSDEQSSRTLLDRTLFARRVLLR